MTTFSEARRLGAPQSLRMAKLASKFPIGIIPGRAVYGWLVNDRGEPIGEYQKLPEGLRGETK